MDTYYGTCLLGFVMLFVPVSSAHCDDNPFRSTAKIYFQKESPQQHFGISKLTHEIDDRGAWAHLSLYFSHKLKGGTALLTHLNKKHVNSGNSRPLARFSSRPWIPCRPGTAENEGHRYTGPMRSHGSTSRKAREHVSGLRSLRECAVIVQCLRDGKGLHTSGTTFH